MKLIVVQTTIPGPSAAVDTSGPLYGLRVRRRVLPRLGGEKTAATAVSGLSAGIREGGTVLSPSRVVVEAVMVATTHAGLDTQINALSAVLQGPLLLRFSDIPDKEWPAFLQDVSKVDEHDPQGIALSAVVTLEFSVPGGFARSQDLVVLPLTNATTTGAIDHGEAPAPVQVTVENAAGATGQITVVDVRVYSTIATILPRRLRWTGVINPGSVFVMDAETLVVTVDGAVANAGIDASSILFPVLDRNGVAGVRGTRIYAFASGATGNAPTITARFRKRWFS